MTERYHYEECGLDNVYLVNGYEYVSGPEGEGVIIQDIDGLHRAIAMHLIYSTSKLSGKEIRFLRHEIGLSQNALARLLGTSEQTVARWEKGQTKDYPVSADRAIRQMYLEKTGSNRKFSDLLRQIADLEHRNNCVDMAFKETQSGWDLADAA